MGRRFPQPVRVGDLIGLPLLDWDNSTLGYVRHVVRTPEGKIQLIVNQGRLFGWGGRLVQVPIEAVAILARQIDLLDISMEEFRAARLVRGHDPTDSIRRYDQDCSLAPLNTPAPMPPTLRASNTGVTSLQFGRFRKFAKRSKA